MVSYFDMLASIFAEMIHEYYHVMDLHLRCESFKLQRHINLVETKNEFKLYLHFRLTIIC